MAELELLTTEEVCHLLKVSDRTLLRWAKKPPENFPKVIKLGTRNRYKKDQIQAYIDSLYSEVA